MIIICARPDHTSARTSITQGKRRDMTEKSNIETDRRKHTYMKQNTTRNARTLIRYGALNAKPKTLQTKPYLIYERLTMLEIKLGCICGKQKMQ